ncbi:glycosyltransferase 87 family protein [Microgenomates group bacterium]|nr:glycosyltransferase 87 family protein [Microgenomates group bacterium]
MITWPKFSTRISKLVLVISTILALLVLYRQAFNPLWRGHLEIDTWNYFLKVEDFIKTEFLFTTIGNEILPATTLFLLIPSFFISKAPFFYSNYLPVFFVLIILSLIYHVFLAAKYGSIKQALIFSWLTLFFGPILLFRFDALAALLVVLSLIYFQQKKFFFSALIFGLVTSIKIYPIIFLPYLMLILLAKRQYKSIAAYLVNFSLGLILPVFVFFSLGGQFSQITDGLNFHALKPVSIESLPGSLITLFSVLTKFKPPQILGGWGVWGIATPLNFFNKFWLLPIFIFYLFLINNKQYLKKISFGIIFCLMLLFLVFSKNLHAQYIWWFLSLFPFIKFQSAKKFKYLLMVVLLIFISIFNQLVYPLFYTQFLEDFYRYNQHYAVFYYLLLRNLLIVVLTVVSLRSVLVKRIIRT